MPRLPVHKQLPEFTQTPRVYTKVGDAIQPSHPLSSPSPPGKLSEWKSQGAFCVIRLLEKSGSKKKPDSQ